MGAQRNNEEFSHQERVHSKRRRQVDNSGGVKQAKDEVEELVTTCAAADECLGNSQELRQRAPEIDLARIRVDVEDFASCQCFSNLQR
jgi:hypothetical protein